MRWKPENGRAGAEVMDEWLDLFYLRARQVLRSLKPWPTSPGLAIIHELREEFKPEWVIDEVAACYGEALPWQELPGLAERLQDGHNTRARDEARAARLAIVEEMRGLCHDSEAISEKCKQLVALG